MSCITVSTMEEASVELPSSIIPIQGLRRDEKGNLTPDALRTIIDSLKSRGIDVTDAGVQKRLMGELSILLCSVNNQYQFLLKELARQVATQTPIRTEFLEMIKRRNLMMLDILNVSRHIEGIRPFDGSSTFIEGWQNDVAGTAGAGAGVAPTTPTEEKLQQEKRMLESRSFEKLRKHMVEVTAEKNRVASNYLGLYGFLNIVAVGLLLYVAGASRGSE